MFVSKEGTILHADVDAFFASVEQRDDPRLRGRPVIVGPGVVMAASYEAKAVGVHGGMGAAAARRLCPDAIVVSPRFDAYVGASKALFAVFERTAPVVEGLSLEEAFLDVRGLERISGSPTEIARRLREEVRERVGLPISVGVARTKVIAKMASGAAKPDGLLVVRPGEEQAFLHPLPVERVWGVGASTAKKLRANGVRTVGEIAALGEPALISILGPTMGRRLCAIAHDRAPRSVRAGRRRRSFGAQRALGRGSRRREELDSVLVGLVDRVTRRMRKSGRVGRTVVLRLRYGDFSRATRSRTLARATAETARILVAARGLLAAAMPTIRRRGLTLVGITVANVEPDGGGVQLALPLYRTEPALDAAIDELRERFGPGSITRAALLDSDPGLSAAVLPGDGPAG
ncbi:MAG: DNA polymerase IV [Solirubrobacterales bacterium]